MKAYLSIDLDYWVNHGADYTDTDIHSYKFFKKVCALNLPIKVVRDHELLLPHINSAKCDLLYNVDYHSDIFGYVDEEEKQKYSSEPPNCGTWANYVEWRESAAFHWIYPNAHCYHKCGSSCGAYGTCWWDELHNPYLSKVIKPFKNMLRSKGCSKINWTSIIAVGISVSPEYTNYLTVKRVLDALGFTDMGCFSDSRIAMDVDDQFIYLPNERKNNGSNA
jgi:hypothetical protein